MLSLLPKRMAKAAAILILVIGPASCSPSLPAPKWVGSTTMAVEGCGQVEITNETAYEIDVELLRVLTSTRCGKFVRPLRLFILNYKSVGVKNNWTYFDAGVGGEPAVTYANQDEVVIVLTTAYGEEAERKGWDTLTPMASCGLKEMRVKPKVSVFLSHLLVHEFLGHAVAKASLFPLFPSYTIEEECYAQRLQFETMQRLGERLLFRRR